MTPPDSGPVIAVANRQRRLKINTRVLAKIAGQLLSSLTDCGARSPQGFAPRHSQTSGGQSFRLPALQDLSIVLVNDAQMAGLNAQYHATQGPTDILTFDYEDGQGELIVSVDHVVANARRFRTTPARELTRYVAHGILHLHGYDDRMSRQRTRMRAAERRLLNRIAQAVHLTSLVRK
jgi:probable rRNA maturation factor